MQQAAAQTPSPFKGLDSYRQEDRYNFYGRDGDSERLISRVLSSRFTLLHARSGAGKTSLLQAKVAPDLEKSGWTVVVTRPERDPIRAVRYEVLKSLAPPPEVERQAILRACEALCPGAVPRDITLKDLVAGYQRLRDREERTESDDEILKVLLGPVRAVPVGAEGGGEAVEYYAQFSRLLGGGLRAADYLAHLAALSDRSPGSGALASAESVSVEDILASLEEAAAGLYQALLSTLDAPADTLVLFFRRLFAIYGSWRPGLRLVLVFDQFEELFTQYGHVEEGATSQDGVGAMRLSSYRLRDQFFEQLGGLYFSLFSRQAPLDEDTPSGSPETPLPVCCVISIRQEFLAELDPVRGFVSDLDQWSFHLDRLTPAAAKGVLRKATRHTPRPFGDGVIDTIVSDLTKEMLYVEPAELQVVVARMWREDGPPEKALEDLGGAKTILDLFLAEFLAEARLDSEQKTDRDKVRVEVLEILQALVTARGKNPTPVPDLVGAPFRVKERREALLQLLIAGRLIRIEAKEGTSIAEIRHDFLIRRILRTVQKELIENAEHGRFVSTLAVLGLCLRTGRLLTWSEFEDLARNEGDIYWNEESLDGVRLRWTPAELMLRSALMFEDPLPESRLDGHRPIGDPSRRPLLADYLRNFAGRLKGPSAAFTTGTIPVDWHQGLLNHGQLTTLNLNPDSWPLSQEQLLVVIRSHLEWCGDGTRTLIDYWTNRWKTEVTSHV